MVRQGDGSLIGDITDQESEPLSLSISDALLIAAAPELLHALRALMYTQPGNWANFDDKQHEVYRAVLENAKSTIAKAEGR